MAERNHKVVGRIKIENVGKTFENADGEVKEMAETMLYHPVFHYRK